MFEPPPLPVSSPPGGRFAAFEALPRWQRALYWTAVGLVFAAFLAACLHAIANVWQWGHNGFNGAAFSQAARNSLRFDMVAQAQYYFELAPPDPDRFYTHHPMMLHFHLMAAHGALGFEAWVARLVPAFYSFAALVMLFVVTRRFLGHAVALVAIALWATTPLNLIFANMVNHEQGSLFWCLAFVGSTLAWLESPRRRWLLLTLLATTMAVQFDWPGYYIAFFVAVYVFATGVRRLPGLFAWRREYTFVAVYSVVVLANFFGFFGWIASVRGSLDEMGHAFLWRSASHEGYLALLWLRSLDLHGLVLLVLLAVWAVSYAVRLPFGRTHRGEVVALFFLLAQLIHSAVFKSAGAIHAYWVWHLNPAIAIGGALVLVWLARTALSLLGRSLAPLGPRTARRLAVASVALVALPLVHHQTAFAWDRLRWGFQTGSASYVYPYDDQYLQVQWARALARRYPRGTVRYLAHHSLADRIEVRWYLDAPIRDEYGLTVAAPDLQPGERPVLLIDLARLNPNATLSALVERHGATVWDGRFVAIDGSQRGGTLEAYRAIAQPPSWLWRWLVNPDRPPIAWVREDVPQTVRDLLVQGQATPWKGLAGGKRGHPRQWRCAEGQVLAELSVRSGRLGPEELVGAIRPRCRALDPGGAERTGPPDEASALGPWFGGRGDDGRTLSCRANELPVGVHGRSGLFVDAVGLLCTARGYLRPTRPDTRPPERPQPRPSRVLGGPGGYPFELQCPPRSVLVGVRVRSGALLDAVGIECKPLAAPGPPYGMGAAPETPTPPPVAPVDPREAPPETPPPEGGVPPVRAPRERSP